MEDISTETGVTVQKLDADVDTEWMTDYNVVSVPTVIKVDDVGEEVVRIVGAKPKAVAMRELQL